MCLYLSANLKIILIESIYFKYRDLGFNPNLKTVNYILLSLISDYQQMGRIPFSKNNFSSTFLFIIKRLCMKTGRYSFLLN